MANYNDSGDLPGDLIADDLSFTQKEEINAGGGS